MRLNFPPRTIRNRLLLVTASCLLTTFFGMAVVIVFGLPHGRLPGGLRQHEHEALARLSAVADNKKGLLTLWFKERLGDLKLAGQNPLLAAYLALQPPADRLPANGGIGIEQRRRDVTAWLRDIRRIYADYDHLELVAEREGTILISTDSRRIGGRFPLPEQYTAEIPIHGDPFAFFISEHEGKTAHLCLAIHLAPPSVATIATALVFHIDTSVLINKLQDIPLLGASGNIMLVDMNQILLTPLPYPLQDGKLAIPLQTRMETKMTQFAAWGNDGVMQAPDCRGVPVLGAVRHIRVLPDFGLGMVVKQDQAEVFAPIYRHMTTLAAIACFGLAFLLTAIFFMARSLLKPVEQVIDAACRLRDGELSARAPETGSGEAQVLAIAFNVMAGEVQRWNETLHTLVEERTAELISMNEELQDRTCQLEALNAELESFNHTVSHDLRTPIRALAGFPDLLEAHLGERLDDKGRQYLAAIRSAANRMAEITTDLLNFSRLGRVDIAKTDVDLSALVRKVMEDLTAMAEGRQVEWQVSDLPVVKGDANLLRIALTNLLANALKFTRRKGEAVIRVDSSVGEDGLPIIKVSDNGAGFDMRYADRLFKVFSRLHPAEDFEGIGIGLATVSRIVRRHGGKVWAEGSPGKGASFSFTVAPSPLDAPPPPPSTTADGPLADRNKK